MTNCTLPSPSNGRKVCPHPSSLIIASRNRPQLLKETIESVLNGDVLPYEIIIVDQSDVRNEHLIELSTKEGCEIRYSWNRSSGVSRARNAGIKAAKHSILAFIDDDVLVTPTWFGSLISAIVNAAPQGIVVGKVLPGESDMLGAFAPSTKDEEQTIVYEGYSERTVLYSSNMALTTHVIHYVGLFDERLGPGTSFPGAEDSDLGLRILAGGFQIVYVPEATITHRAWRTPSDYLPLRWKYGVGRGGFYAKHLNRVGGSVRRTMLRDVQIHLWSVPSLYRHSRHQAIGNLVLVAGILYGTIRWLLTQSRTPSNSASS